MEPSGYLHPGYAASLTEFGTLRPLPRSGGWILVRAIPSSEARDAMGCYPLFACRDWSRLPEDLAEAGADLVSLSLVTDPFGAYDPVDLESWFDVSRPFKEHMVVELDRPGDRIASRHHRYYARRALEHLSVEVVEAPEGALDEWVELYGTLVRRHRMSGIHAFSRAAFARQLALPGAVLFRASYRGEPVGAQLWYEQEGVAYSHLQATSPSGYRMYAAYALYWTALGWFRGRVGWLDLGAGAGAASEGADGLARFKRGWSSGRRWTYLCGRIFDPERYEALSRARGAGTGYFPAYRAGEFA
jgi:hypothetical protein